MSTSPNPLTTQSVPVSRGRWLLVLSALAFSTAGFFTRAAPVDLWAMILWRNLFGSAGLALILVVTDRGAQSLGRRIGGTGWAVIASSSLGTVCYLAAFQRTSVADISIVYATAPLITAAMAWIWRREAMSRRTLCASGIALIGVGLTVAGAVGTGGFFGDALALAMTLSFSAMTVLARGTVLPAMATALLSSLLTAAVALPLGWSNGASFPITLGNAGWLACFGVVSMALALPCYLAGAKGVPSGEAMLISALELPFAPLWVWLAFGETVSATSLIGGGIVAVAVLLALA